MLFSIIKVGVIGLVEEEWIATLSTIDPADIIYEDFVEVGNRLATELREEVGLLALENCHLTCFLVIVVVI